VFDAVPEIVDHLPETPTTGITQLPRVLLEVKPVYDRATAKDGSVTMECIVLADGSVGDVRIESSLDPALGLDQAAVLAAKRWRFVPAKRGVESVPSRIRVELFFVRR
jgi:TonB family protein